MCRSTRVHAVLYGKGGMAEWKFTKKYFKIIHRCVIILGSKSMNAYEYETVGGDNDETYQNTEYTDIE